MGYCAVDFARYSRRMISSVVKLYCKMFGHRRSEVLRTRNFISGFWQSHCVTWRVPMFKDVDGEWRPFAANDNNGTA